MRLKLLLLHLALIFGIWTLCRTLGLTPWLDL